MKRELGIARCGLACCLCSENDRCSGIFGDYDGFDDVEHLIEFIRTGKRLTDCTSNDKAPSCVGGCFVVGIPF